MSKKPFLRYRQSPQRFRPPSRPGENESPVPYPRSFAELTASPPRKTPRFSDLKYKVNETKQNNNSSIPNRTAFESQYSL